MILATNGGNREVRSMGSWMDAFVPPPGALTGGSRGRRDLAVAAVACAVRLVADTVGGMVVRTYHGDSMDRRPVLTDPVAEVFQYPADDVTSVDLWSDVATSLELEKHAFIWKVKAGGQVVELIPMDPGLFHVTRQKPTSPKVIRARVNGEATDVTKDVIHIRGWAAVPGVDGVSTIDLHRQTFHSAQALDEYRGRYFDNDAAPGVVIEMPGRPTKDQRRDMLASWVRRHGGPQNKNRPGLLYGGAKLVVPTPSLRDSQAAEMTRAIATDVARAFRIYPIDLVHAALAGTLPPSAEVWSDMFLRFSLFGRLRRIERALSADLDLYPDRRRYARFDVNDFHRGDLQTTASTIHNLVQVGVMTPNEGRGQLGLVPVATGDILNWPPVGGTSPDKGGNAPAQADPPPDPDVDPDDDPDSQED